MIPHLIRSLRMASGIVIFAATLFQNQASSLLSEKFDYPDGPLVANAGGRWSVHSGKTNEIDLLGGRITLTQSQTEDVNAALSGGPYASASSIKALYASFKIRFITATTTSNGAYFAHFKDSANGFRARIWAVTNGAPSGSVRVGISSGGNAATEILPKDLKPGTDHTLVLRYELATASSRLWVDPLTESDQSAQSSDSQSTISVAAFAFRQNSGLGSCSVDELVVATSFAEAIAGPGGTVVPLSPPSITTAPASQTVKAGSDVTFTVVASGEGTIGYQWLFNGTLLDGQTQPALVLKNVGKAEAGAYSVRVQNSAGILQSEGAQLTVRVAEVPVVEPIAALRNLVDPVGFFVPQSTNLHTVEGIVISRVNLAGGPDVLFFLQDGTAGIAVNWSGGASQFVPEAGERIRVTAVLGQADGLLQLLPRDATPGSRVTRTGINQALPTPRPLLLSATKDPARMESLEGSLVVLSNVSFAATTPMFPKSGVVIVTNALGDPFGIRINARSTDLSGQALPPGLVNIVGVLGQNDSTAPATGDYELIPTSRADIQTGLVPPSLVFTNRISPSRQWQAPTNSFAENVVRPEERIVMTAEVSDPLGGPITVSPDLEGMPPTASWTISSLSPSRVSATLSFVPTHLDDGKLFRFRLNASNSQAATSGLWMIHVPSSLEQKVEITEFLAGRAELDDPALSNPLKRDVPSTGAENDDEFVELVNLSDLILDFAGWTLSDSSKLLHRFTETFNVDAMSAFLIYGGPLRGFEPKLGVPCSPASEGSLELRVHRTDGDMLLLRNPEGNLVSRIVYGSLPAGQSMVRNPGSSEGFVPHLSVSALAVSPGREVDGKMFNGTNPESPVPVEIRVSIQSGTRISIQWTPAPGRKYSVEHAPSPTGPFTSADGATAPDAYSEPVTATARYYRVLVQ